MNGRMAGITRKQADGLYELIDFLAEDALTVRDDLLGSLSDPETKGVERTALTEDLVATLADLRDQWRRLGEFAGRVPGLHWPADAPARRRRS